MEDKGYHQLNVFRKADELVVMVYKYTRKFPKEELFGLISQMRRSAVSVVANIVEGYARRTLNDKLQFYYIARGSLTELEYYIELTPRLEYLTDEESKDLQNLRDDAGRLLNGFIRSLTK